MKRKHKITLILAFLVLSTIFSLIVSAQDSSVPSAEQVLGFNPENIPQSPEEISNQYLKQEWGKIIEANAYLGPIHRFFTSYSIIFQILFAEPYVLSPILLIIIVLWFFVALKAGKILKATEIVKPGVATLIGFGIAIVAAQMRILSIITRKSYDLVFSKELWYMRLIMGLVIIVILVLLFYLSDFFAQYLQEQEKNKKEKLQRRKTETLEQKEKVSEAFIKGVKKGEKLSR